MTDENKIINCYPEDDFLNSDDCPDGGIVGPEDKGPGSGSFEDRDPCDVTEGSRAICPPMEDDPCYPWQLTDIDEESCIIEDYIEESITIGGAKVNVHKMLGIYEQDKLVDQVGMGEAMSSGDHPNFPAANAFDYYDTEWRSLHLGSDVVKKSYLGYDFGPIRLDNGRLRYGIETFVKKNVATIKLKQGCDSKNRVTRVRIERSADGKKWYGSSILNIPDCEGAVEIRFKASSPSRYWRLRPVKFNGGDSDYWAVKALVLSEREHTALENIQDKIFLENRDRQYAKDAVLTKASYTPVDYQGFLAKMGFNSPFNTEQFLFEFSFQQIVRLVGRPLVIGDIIQLPSETYFTPRLKETLKYLEVTNVAWASTGFTPHWVPTLLRVVAEPAMASQETQDIFGKLTEDSDELGTVDINDGIRDKKYQDVHDIDQTVQAEANTAVPQKGQDYANKTKLSDELKDWIDGNIPGLDSRKIDRARYQWGVDALPPNGEDYTTGDNFPNKPKDGDYHRLTYDSIDRNLAPRLYRYSKAKNRWIFLETDTRFKHKNTKPVLTDFLFPSRDDEDQRSDINKIEETLRSKKSNKNGEDG